MSDKTEQKDKKNGFVFYESWYEGAKYLKGKHRLAYLEAIINYGLFGEEIETKGVENALFCAIKPTIKFNRKQKTNGEKGGGTEGNSNASKTTQKRPKNDPNPPESINDKDKDNDNDLYNDKEDDEDKGKSSVVVGLLDFLNNIYGDFNFTPSQVALINSKPADYWESFMDEVQASKWLKGKDPALALRLHEKVVNGEYRTYTDKAKPEQPQPAPYKPTPEEQQINDLLDEWRTLPKDAYKGDNLDEMRKRHGQLPDEFLKSIGMCFFRGSWYWKS